MKSLLAFASLVPLAWSWAPLAQRADDWQGVECIEEIEIPRYSALARLAIKTGTVRAQVEIGKDGRLANVSLEAPDPRLADDVRAWLEHTGRFRRACAGREVTLLVTFRLQGEATHYPSVIVHYRPPNHFIITSQPRLPHILYMPVEPPKKGEKRGGP